MAESTTNRAHPLVSDLVAQAKPLYALRRDFGQNVLDVPNRLLDVDFAPTGGHFVWCAAAQPAAADPPVGQGSAVGAECMMLTHPVKDVDDGGIRMKRRRTYREKGSDPRHRIDMGERYQRIKAMPPDNAGYLADPEAYHRRIHNRPPASPADQPGAGRHGYVGGEPK